MAARAEMTRVRKVAEATSLLALDPKPFTPKNDNLPILQSYQGVLSTKYWEQWVMTSMHDVEGDKSWIDGSKFKKACDMAEVADPGRTEYIQEGVDIECRSEHRWATNGKHIT